MARSLPPPPPALFGAAPLSLAAALRITFSERNCLKSGLFTS
eukprot:CAMPEP_0181495548 /NCGR_PEP_ID=MMETSP1110-20121109/52449_1 /TAXON_ID=174948 /ORGANISM="Symbiodinium sp., Strain CCMP421" /LENGTH=41 /DNA_ID= /DNA_START= /DNA_END= /DNA_ORIENTATION=